MRYLSGKKHNFLISLINYRAILILLMTNWDKFFSYYMPLLLNRILKLFNTKFSTQFFIQTLDYIKWALEQIIYVVSAKVSLNH